MVEFIKHNSSPFSDSLSAEVHGLESLRAVLQIINNDDLHIPKVYSVNEKTLKLQAIKTQSNTGDQMTVLGRGLADLHQIEQSYYGLDRDNYIGLSEQKNGQYDDWGEFFVTQRLAFQVSLIKPAALQQSLQNILQRNKARVVSFLNQHCSGPSLVHGDLWSGNVLFEANEYSGEEGRVWLIDPAVYYGDREVDIAMTEMFGGFSAEFYRRYDQAYPLSSAYPEKKVIYNLYHQLNHYNVFGRSYLQGCKRGFDVLSRL